MFAKLLNLCDYIVQILSYKCAAKKKREKAGKKQAKAVGRNKEKAVGRKSNVLKI